MAAQMDQTVKNSPSAISSSFGAFDSLGKLLNRPVRPNSCNTILGNFKANFSDSPAISLQEKQISQLKPDTSGRSDHSGNGTGGKIVHYSLF